MNNLELMLSREIDFLKREFDMDAPKAGIKFHDAQEWHRLTAQLNFPTLEAFYSSPADLVYAPEKATIPVLIHEYLGHAMFSEQSDLGRKLRSYENELRRNETPKIRSEYKDFISKTRPVQEAFAMNIEKIVLEGLGFDSLWNEREKQFKYRKDYPAFCSLMSDISNKGFLSVLYELGFPKSSRKEILLKFAMENLKTSEGLKYLIAYGSRKRDLDMLAVYGDNIKLAAQNIFHKNAADIILLNEGIFLKRLELLDIEITEPLLTGDILFGDENALGRVMLRVYRAAPSKEAIEYSGKRSIQTFNSALFFFGQHKYRGNEHMLATQSLENAAKLMLANQPAQPSQDLLYCLANLSFSLSYSLAAKEQEKGDKIILFKGLLAKDCLLQELFSYIKDVEYNRTPLEEERTVQFLNRVKERLAKQYT